ncbi:NAD(P)H-binding protein [uncultured Pseudokineococcus sp.]|uniref:NAD(P)H-binding protein n=1 Tax=uncultured Pseudokineococcus sp. TaxID=1642928 RepID=UPI00262E9892|nr:NAD(P)H-binding protein [uncultured Pseudokineococcus sp.]
MIMVTGASGQLGSLVHHRLMERGLSPLAGTRAPERFGDLGRRVDFDDPSMLDLAGVSTLVLVSAGYDEDDVVIAHHDRVITAAQSHGVGHVVCTSLTGAGDHLGFALAHRWTERRLQRSGLAWTVLRNGLYAELFGALAAPVDAVVSAPFGDGALAAAAREGLADVAAAVAADPSAHRGRTYELAGTTTVDAAGLAAGLGATCSPTSLARRRTELASAGLLPFQPAMLMSVYSSVAAGLLAGTGGDLADLLDVPLAWADRPRRRSGLSEGGQCDEGEVGAQPSSSRGPAGGARCPRCSWSRRARPTGRRPRRCGGEGRSGRPQPAGRVLPAAAGVPRKVCR